ncbi:MAG: N-acetylglucosaminyl-diphospho-decaprenol L-rhamnosyltransferase [Gammaproteobacteria bacterium]|jgi:N-acetylglucosaminyl-diphospho-decaprenol L-rhamnosyltransferase
MQAMTPHTSNENVEEGPALSIVIVNYNGGDRVLACVESIFAHGGARPVEVIIYDNASRDGTAESIAEQFPGVDLIRGNENLGLCRAFNIGAKRALAPFILALDNDTRLLDGALDEMLDFLQSHPEVGAVGSNLYNPDMTLQLAARRFPNAMSALFGRRSRLTRLFPGNRIAQHDLMIDHSTSATPFEIDWHSAASLMMRREVYESVGGFDENFFVYWSDADLCARIRAKGFLIYNVPSAKIIHDETLAGGKGKTSPRMVIDFHRGAYQFYRNHRIRGRANPMAALAWLGLASRAAAVIFFDHVRWKIRQFKSGLNAPEQS